MAAADLDRIIARDFEPGARDRAREILARYGHEAWHDDVLRVHLACLKCADGKLDALERMVAAADTDFRDVLVAAEYPRSAGAADPATLRAARKADREEYQQWLNRP